MEKNLWFDYRNSTIDIALNAQEQWFWRELEKDTTWLEAPANGSESRNSSPQNQTNQIKLSPD